MEFLIELLLKKWTFGSLLVLFWSFRSLAPFGFGCFACFGLFFRLFRWFARFAGFVRLFWVLEHAICIVANCSFTYTPTSPPKRTHLDNTFCIAWKARQREKQSNRFEILPKTFRSVNSTSSKRWQKATEGDSIFWNWEFSWKTLQRWIWWN